MNTYILLILASRLDLLKFVKKEVKKQQQLFLKRERNYQIEKLIPSVHIYLFLKKIMHQTLYLLIL